MVIDKKRRKLVKDFNRKNKQWETVPCLCGADNYKVLAKKDRYGINQQTVICKVCGLIYSNPRLTEEEYKKFYQSDLYRQVYDGDYDYEALYKPTNEIYELCKRFSSCESVLEIGAGGGWNLLPFKNAVGYEYSPALIAMGKSKGIDMRFGGIADVEGKYDVIILNHVLEHLSHPIEDMRKLSDHLNEEGIIYVAVPDMKNYHVEGLQNAHTYYFNWRTLEYFLSFADLRMVQAAAAERVHLAAILKKGGGPIIESWFLQGNYQHQLEVIRHNRPTLWERFKVLIHRVLDIPS